MTRRPPIAVATLAALVTFAACGGGRGSPREVFESLRAALSAHDGEAMRDLLDAESIGFRRQFVREWRALLASGMDKKDALDNAPLEPEEINRGSEADVVALLLSRNSPLMKEADWYVRASVVKEEADGEDASCLTLRGLDGVERELWFLREDGRWTFDLYRTKRPWR